MFKVETGIKISGVIPSGERPRFYPFVDMEVGDSFFIPEGTVSDRGAVIDNTTVISSAAYNYSKFRGIKFSVRKVEGGFRCWRVK